MGLAGHLMPFLVKRSAGSVVVGVRALSITGGIAIVAGRSPCRPQWEMGEIVELRK